MNRRRHRDRGQALPEFALIAPILFLLLFGVIQLGLIMAAQNGLVNAVRDSTRKAATYRVNELTFASTTVCTDIQDQLEADLATSIPWFAAADLTSDISYEWAQDPDSSQWFVVAHVEAWYKNVLYVPLVSIFLDRADGTADERLELYAGEQMRIENPALDAPASTTDPC
jgi:Flp pilus assembly protein TadG